MSYMIEHNKGKGGRFGKKPVEVLEIGDEVRIQVKQHDLIVADDHFKTVVIRHPRKLQSRSKY